MNRYNEYGYWKPYSDIPDYLGFHKKIYSMNLPEDVKDVLFYCKHTNCCVIEFVIKTYLELPYPSTDFSIYTINMFKCEHIYEYCKTRQLCVYDCTFPLENDGIDTITKALNNISIEMNRLAFYYDAPLTWRLKYKDKERNPVSISPSDDFLKNNPIPAYLTNINQDRVYLNMAAEWYRIANISSDLFVAFSAYYFALETLIFAKTDCGANFNISVEYIKKDAETCFDSIIKSQKTKSEIIKELYFDCFGSNKDKTIWFIKELFGCDSEYLSEFSNGKYSILTLRSKIVHGNKEIINAHAIDMIRKKLPLLKDILRNTMLRICLQLKPSDNIPKWHIGFTWRGLTGDPRQDAAVPNCDGFDFRIRPEWCD